MNNLDVLNVLNKMGYEMDNSGLFDDIKSVYTSVLIFIIQISMFFAIIVYGIDYLNRFSEYGVFTLIIGVVGSFVLVGVCTAFTFAVTQGNKLLSILVLSVMSIGALIMITSYLTFGNYSIEHFYSMIREFGKMLDRNIISFIKELLY